MKRTLLLIISVIFICGSLTGQTRKFNYIDSKIPRIYYPLNEQQKYRNPGIDTNKKFYRNYDLLIDIPSGSVMQRDTAQNKSMPHLVSPDSIAGKMFPGSSVFYGKKRFLHPYSYEKSFIVRPDTTVKYYLIIKNPITQEVIR